MNSGHNLFIILLRHDKIGRDSCSRPTVGAACRWLLAAASIKLCSECWGRMRCMSIWMVVMRSYTPYLCRYYMHILGRRQSKPAPGPAHAYTLATAPRLNRGTRTQHHGTASHCERRRTPARILLLGRAPDPALPPVRRGATSKFQSPPRQQNSRKDPPPDASLRDRRLSCSQNPPP